MSMSVNDQNLESKCHKCNLCIFENSDEIATTIEILSLLVKTFQQFQ